MALSVVGFSKQLGYDMVVWSWHLVGGSPDLRLGCSRMPSATPVQHLLQFTLAPGLKLAEVEWTLEPVLWPKGLHG